MTSFADYEVKALGTGEIKIEGQTPMERASALSFFRNKLTADRLQDLRLWLGMDSE